MEVLGDVEFTLDLQDLDLVPLTVCSEGLGRGYMVLAAVCGFALDSI